MCMRRVVRQVAQGVRQGRLFFVGDGMREQCGIVWDQESDVKDSDDNERGSKML